jgi:hypothetical protein
MRKAELANKLKQLNNLAPLPSGYHYQIDSNGGGGGPRYYNLAVVRNDFKHGDFIDLPSMGGFKANVMVRYLEGLIEGLLWKARIKNGLPPVRRVRPWKYPDPRSPQSVEGQDRANYTDDQDRKSYTQEEDNV